MGYSRASFYRFQVEQAVREIALEQPAWGQARASNELLRRGISISPFGVRCV